MVCLNRNEWGAWQERLIVCGHADTSGEPKRNYEVAELRAQMVKALLDQNGEDWKTMASRYGKARDFKRILKSLAVAYGWDCDPGDVDNKSNPESDTAVKSFKQACNERYAMELEVNGEMDEAGWAAIYRALCALVCEHLDIAGSATPKPPNWVKPIYGYPDGKGVYSCGESFPVAAVGRDGVESQENRRVELVFAPKDLEVKGTPSKNVNMKSKDCVLYDRERVEMVGVVPNFLQGLLICVRFKGNITLEAVCRNEKTLSLLSQGDSVYRVQKMLYDAGYSIPEDKVNGVYDVETKQTVSEFQNVMTICRIMDLEASGIIDSKTLKAMDKEFYSLPNNWFNFLTKVLNRMEVAIEANGLANGTKLCYEGACFDGDNHLEFGLQKEIGGEISCKFDSSMWIKDEYERTISLDKQKRKYLCFRPIDAGKPYLAIIAFYNNMGSWSLDCAFTPEFAILCAFALSLGADRFNERFNGLVVKQFSSTATTKKLMDLIRIEDTKSEILWHNVPSGTLISWVNYINGPQIGGAYVENGIKQESGQHALYTCHPFGGKLSEEEVGDKLSSENHDYRLLNSNEEKNAYQKRNIRRAYLLLLRHL